MTDTAASGRTGSGTSGRTSRGGAESAPVSGGGTARGLDLATLIGLAGSFVLIGAAIALGGAWNAFVNLPSILIVVGGTIGVTMVSFSLGEMLQAQKLLARSFTYPRRDARDAAHRMLDLAEKARREGLLSLQNSMTALRDAPFLARGLTMVIDGTPGADAERVMRTEMHAIAERHIRSAGILRRAAEVSPAMGLIGTLVGLVQMLGRLDDPSTIGPAMAVALLTTLYGAILGTMVFSPLAGKLEKRSVEEALLNEVYLLGVGSIGRRENPRRLEMMINTVLPPAKRIAVYQ